LEARVGNKKGGAAARLGRWMVDKCAGRKQKKKLTRKKKKYLPRNTEHGSRNTEASSPVCHRVPLYCYYTYVHPAATLSVFPLLCCEELHATTVPSSNLCPRSLSLTCAESCGWRNARNFCPRLSTAVHPPRKGLVGVHRLERSTRRSHGSRNRHKGVALVAASYS
jgi:hypothetical protein